MNQPAKLKWEYFSTISSTLNNEMNLNLTRTVLTMVNFTPLQSENRETTNNSIEKILFMQNVKNAINAEEI